jgi:hypothetical protein
MYSCWYSSCASRIASLHFYFSWMSLQEIWWYMVHKMSQMRGKMSHEAIHKKQCHVPHIIDESMTFWSAKNVMIIRDILEFCHEHLIKPNPSPITYEVFLSQIMPRGSHHLNSHQPSVADVINSMTFLFLHGFCPSTIIQCLIYWE